jgi:hypothetical protein
MREFKDSITGHHKDEEEDERPALTPAESTPPAPPPSVPERESAELGSRKSGS